ncbi:hypothetical protein PoB_002700900 [Plakobranchus ocellatus]|uniref:Uncharacterized protein n=1 Tax=Plakobranchus ocellatus TaxID=259542 RepID=A0AAV4A1P2_9GAST|nr:hypothetical protein PoB_002700900 [Plakobranchus ocellatus]
MIKNRVIKTKDLGLYRIVGLHEQKQEMDRLDWEQDGERSMVKKNKAGEKGVSYASHCIRSATDDDVDDDHDDSDDDDDDDDDNDDDDNDDDDDDDDD